MTWTYSGDPSSTARDAIRFLVGDTDTTDQLLTDEEIAWINSQAAGTTTATTALYDAAHRACHAIAGKLSRLADKSIGDLSVSLSQKAAAYRVQANELKTLALRSGSVPIPYAGGISISDKNIDEEDSDRFGPWFKSGQFEDVRDGGRTNTITGVQWFGAGADF